MIAPITALYAGLLALLILALAVRVVWLRNVHHVGLGTGGNEILGRAIRVHGNAVEYLPIALLLMLCLELDHGPHWLLHACGIVLIAARLLHAFGVSHSAGRSFGRAAGAAGTMLVIAVLAVVNIIGFMVPV
ncbi:MAG: MAPEG family protein [Gammaproteobacteria bacterium]